MTNPTGSGFAGQMGLNDPIGQFNATWFCISQFMGRVAIAKIVKVVAVTPGSGDPPAVGFVDVLPLLTIVDGLSQSTKEGTVFHIPYFRYQGGACAIVLDPAVDDIGFLVIADRDISAVKETKKAANPGSSRRFNMADGVYFGGLFAAAPTKFVQFKGNDLVANGFTNITATATTLITLKAPNIKIDGKLEVTGDVTLDAAFACTDVHATGEVTAHYGGSIITLTQHLHSANNTPPTPGH